MEHTSKGKSKVLKSCSLPLTGKSVVDMLITDLAVFKFRENQMELIEIAKGKTLDEIKAAT